MPSDSPSIELRPLDPRDVEAPLTPQEQRQIAFQLGPLLLGAGLLGVGSLYGYLVPDQADLAAAIQAVAAMLVGAPILRRGLRGFLSHEPADLTEQLVSLAVLASMAVGEFVTAGLVPLFLELGHLFEERSSRGAVAAIDGIRKLSSVRATRVRAGVEEEVDPDQLAEGDELIVRPGQTIPVDGQVVSGHSSVDQAPITGESVHEDVQPGDSVYGGTINLGGVLRLRASGEVNTSILGRVVETLREVEQSKTPVLRLIERYAGVYLPVVLSIAGVTLFVTGELGRAIAVLIVSCPCALVLAGPAAMIVSMTESTRRSILIKSASFLETVAEVDTLILDKTGTVTAGALSLERLWPSEGIEPDTLLSLAASCAHGSMHPVSRAVLSAALDRGVDVVPCERNEELPGRGVRTEGNRVLRLGRAQWLREEGLTVPDQAPAAGPGVWLARDGQVMGYLSLSDRPRSEAAAALEHTRQLGMEHIVLLTGDREEVARDVATQLGFDSYVAEVLPEQKLEIVREEQAKGRKVMMVGDGVNDALALSGADVGVAVGARVNEVALGGADVALLTEDLGALPTMMELADRTRAIVVQNALLGSVFSVGMVALASAGVVTALTGALLHNAGALFVIANSSRLSRAR